MTTRTFQKMSLELRPQLKGAVASPQQGGTSLVVRAPRCRVQRHAGRRRPLHEVPKDADGISCVPTRWKYRCFAPARILLLLLLLLLLSPPFSPPLVYFIPSCLQPTPTHPTHKATSCASLPMRYAIRMRSETLTLACRACAPEAVDLLLGNLLLPLLLPLVLDLAF
jgi:hypothetical protein